VLILTRPNKREYEKRKNELLDVIKEHDVHLKEHREKKAEELFKGHDDMKLVYDEKHKYRKIKKELQLKEREKHVAFNPINEKINKLNEHIKSSESNEEKAKLQDSLDSLTSENKTLLDDYWEALKQLKKVSKKVEKRKFRLKEFKQKEENRSLEFKRIKSEIKTIKDTNAKIQAEIDELTKEYEMKLHDYKNQQELIALIKHEEEKEKSSVVLKNTYQKEIESCQYLIGNFKLKLEIAAEQVERKNSVEDKECNQENQECQGEERKKKGKAPKDSNRKLSCSDILILESNIIEELNNLNFSVPVYRKDLPVTIGLIESKLLEFEKLAFETQQS